MDNSTTIILFVILGVVIAGFLIWGFYLTAVYGLKPHYFLQYGTFDIEIIQMSNSRYDLYINKQFIGSKNSGPFQTYTKFAWGIQLGNEEALIGLNVSKSKHALFYGQKMEMVVNNQLYIFKKLTKKEIEQMNLNQV